jgi:anti-anti-sigma factor
MSGNTATRISDDTQCNKLLTIELEEHFDFRFINSFRSQCCGKYNEDVDVVIDMLATRYMDSSGVALLLCLYQWVKAPKVEVYISNCHNDIRDILLRSRVAGKFILED